MAVPPIQTLYLYLTVRVPSLPGPDLPIYLVETPVPGGPMTPAKEIDLVEGSVDVREPGRTEPDEETVLADLYGPADHDGVFRGEPR